MNLIIPIYFICFSLLLFIVQAAPSINVDEYAYWESIYNSTIHLQTIHQPYSKHKEVCYKDIGCFSNNGPMGHTLLLPESPEDIGITYYTFNGNYTNQMHEVDPYHFNTFDIINRDKQLIIIIHGYSSSCKHNLLCKVKESLFKYVHKDIGTVIMVDWKHGARAPLYLQAATNTQVVGRHIAFLVNQLHQKRQIDPRNVYLIGFSLGAQVAGFAGKFSQSEYHWKFGRITGLDSAAPLFEGHPGSYLTKDDAEFVDAIHTSIGNNILEAEFGFTHPYAHIDFYPNGGYHQPRCHIGSPLNCKHSSAVIYYEASLSAENICQFRGHYCKNIENYEDGLCPKWDAIMGYYANMNRKANGKHFLFTSASYPYCDKN